MTNEVNVPLLRKAVEWAEAEAAKPPELCEWEQGHWIITPELRASVMAGADKHYTPDESYQKAPECGTCYCIAGFVTAQAGIPFQGYDCEDVAADLLSIDRGAALDLFCADNTIEDVRRIAESLAGERL